MEEIDLMPTLAEADVALPVEAVPPVLEPASTLDKMKAADAARPGFPGEHWFVLALGIALWQVTRHNRHALVRTLGGLGAGTLVARAASGRAGLSRVLRYTPFGRAVQVCPPPVRRP